MKITGVPLSPEPLVKSHNEPIRSVNTLGVVPSVIICPVKSASLFLISSLIASFNLLNINLVKKIKKKYKKEL